MVSFVNDHVAKEAVHPALMGRFLVCKLKKPEEPEKPKKPDGPKKPDRLEKPERLNYAGFSHADLNSYFEYDLLVVYAG